MGREIERKFLVLRDLWHPGPAGGIRYRQGYLSTDPDRIVRVRTSGDHAWLTVKGITRGVSRSEYEYAIPPKDAEEMLDHICIQPLIEKVRHVVPVGDHRWEVDVFSGANSGLIVAEIELPHADAWFERPSWLGADVSGDPRYFNSNLIIHPYSRWGS